MDRYVEEDSKHYTVADQVPFFGVSNPVGERQHVVDEYDVGDFVEHFHLCGERAVKRPPLSKVDDHSDSRGEMSSKLHEDLRREHNHGDGEEQTPNHEVDREEEYPISSSRVCRHKC